MPVPPPFTEATRREFTGAAFDIAAAELAGAVTPDVGEIPATDSAQVLNGFVVFSQRFNPYRFTSTQVWVSCETS